MGGAWSAVVPLALIGASVVAVVRTERLRRQAPGWALRQRLGLLLVSAPLFVLLLVGAASLPHLAGGVEARALSPADLTGKAMVHVVAYLAVPAVGLALVLGPRRALRAARDSLLPDGEPREAWASAMAWSFWASAALIGAGVSAWSLSRGQGGLLSASGAEVVFANATPGLAVMLAGAAALAEEGLFRGVLFDALDEKMATWAAVLVQALLFGLIHAGYGSIAHVLGATAFGVLMAALAVRQGLLPAIATHFLLNIVILGLWTGRPVLVAAAGLSLAGLAAAAWHLLDTPSRFVDRASGAS